MAMELYDLQVSTSNIHNKLNELGNSLQKEKKQNRIEEIVKMMEDPSFWLDRHLSSSLIKEMNNLKSILESFNKLINWSKSLLDSIEEIRKEYDIEIVKISDSKSVTSKGMIIEVTDNELLEKIAFQCANIMGKTFNMASPFLDSESSELRMNFVHDSIARNGIAAVFRKTPAKIRLKKEKIIDSE